MRTTSSLPAVCTSGGSTSRVKAIITRAMEVASLP